MLYLAHRAEQLFKQLHMKRGVEEREKMGVEDHIIFFLWSQKISNIIPTDNPVMPRRSRILTQVWLAPLDFALQNEICISIH